MRKSAPPQTPTWSAPSPNTKRRSRTRRSSDSSSPMLNIRNTTPKAAMEAMFPCIGEDRKPKRQERVEPAQHMGADQHAGDEEAQHRADAQRRNRGTTTPATPRKAGAPCRAPDRNAPPIASLRENRITDLRNAPNHACWRQMICPAFPTASIASRGWKPPFAPRLGILRPARPRGSTPIGRKRAPKSRRCSTARFC